MKDKLARANAKLALMAPGSQQYEDQVHRIDAFERKGTFALGYKKR